MRRPEPKAHTTAPPLVALRRHTRGKNLEGFFPGHRTPTCLDGVGLPKDVLNYIYWWNAARLIPRVRESLASFGYTV